MTSEELQQKLECALRERLPLAGGMMWPQTWKQKVTPSGRRYCQLAVSAGRTKETGCGLWQTPVSDDAVARKMGKFSSRGEPKLSAQALWHTPRSTMIEESPENFQQRMNSKRSKDRGENATPNLAVQALWATPKASEAEKDSRTPQGAMKEVMRGKSPSLSSQAMSMWPTPSCRDWKDTGDMSNSMVRKDGKSRMDTLGRLTFDGSTAQTESKGSLNPAFVCWLMGYPENYEKLLYMAMETP